jgi:hypothetical protein
MLLEFLLKLSIGISIHYWKQNALLKKGRPPRVFYSPLKLSENITLPASFDSDGILEKNWITIYPDGTRIDGKYAFHFWCIDRGFDTYKKFEEYRGILKKYSSFRKNGLIDATDKFISTFSHVPLEKVFYLDFFSYEIFGRTKWGQLVLHAKLSEDKQLMKEVFSWAKPKIENIIKEYNIDCVGYIPHSLKRKKSIFATTEEFSSSFDLRTAS